MSRMLLNEENDVLLNKLILTRVASGKSLIHVEVTRAVERDPSCRARPSNAGHRWVMDVRFNFEIVSVPTAARTFELGTSKRWATLPPHDFQVVYWDDKCVIATVIHVLGKSSTFKGTFRRNFILALQEWLGVNVMDQVGNPVWMQSIMTSNFKFPQITRTGDWWLCEPAMNGKSARKVPIIFPYGTVKSNGMPLDFEDIILAITPASEYERLTLGEWMTRLQKGHVAIVDGKVVDAWQ